MRLPEPPSPRVVEPCKIVMVDKLGTHKCKSYARHPGVHDFDRGYRYFYDPETGKLHKLDADDSPIEE